MKTTVVGGEIFAAPWSWDIPGVLPGFPETQSERIIQQLQTKLGNVSIGKTY